MGHRRIQGGSLGTSCLAQSQLGGDERGPLDLLSWSKGSVPAGLELCCWTEVGRVGRGESKLSPSLVQSPGATDSLQLAGSCLQGPLQGPGSLIRAASACLLEAGPAPWGLLGPSLSPPVTSLLLHREATVSPGWPSLQGRESGLGWVGGLRKKLRGPA